MTEDDRPRVADRHERIFKALSHPTRHQVLVLLNERPASPTELAERIGEPLTKVAYHVRTLARLGAVELVGTRQQRGAVEHIYRATTRPMIDDEMWARLPVSVRRKFTDMTLEQIWDHIVEAARVGGFDARDVHVSWTTVDLDEAGRAEMSELLLDTLDQALEIHARSAGRLTELDEDDRESQRSEIAILHYDRPRKGEGKTSPS